MRTRSRSVQPRALGDAGAILMHWSTDDDTVMTGNQDPAVAPPAPSEPAATAVVQPPPLPPIQRVAQLL
jgi:hypothetical protein